MLDLGQARALLADGGKGMVTVSRAWLEQAILEIEAGRVAAVALRMEKQTQGVMFGLREGVKL